MADRTIGSLTRAPDLYDDSLLVIELQGAVYCITGAQLKKYARQGVQDYVEDAQKAAEAAQQAVESVGSSVEEAQAARDAAQVAQTGAEAARKAIEDLEVSVDTLAAGTPASVAKTAKEGHVLLRFGLPRGPEGPKGDPGSSIQKIERTAGTGAAGTVDTYTITLTDGSTATFQVRNGADGDGSGDMSMSVYDPQNKSTDIFEYVDNAVSAVDPSLFLQKTGGTMTGAIKFDANDQQYKTIFQAFRGESQVYGRAMFPVSGAAYISLLRDWYEGDISSPQPLRLSGIATPTENYDAANKSYVDFLVGDISSVLDSILGEVV